MSLLRAIYQSLWLGRLIKGPVNRVSIDNVSDFRILNPVETRSPHMTVIVIGVERGGTSMVAGVLDKLGVYMGETDNAVYEDHELAHCIKLNDLGAAKRIIAQRNVKHPIWGFKKPTLKLLKQRWRGLFREPVYVVIFRDVIAVANRRAVSKGESITEVAPRIADNYQKIVRFMLSERRPILLVSYEKALLYPELFVTRIKQFLGLPENAAIDEQAIEFIKPSPEAYHRASRANNNWLGHLEFVGENQIIGWCFDKHKPESVEVGLFVNDIQLAVTKASLSRNDVRQYHHRDSDLCGFIFQKGEGCQWHSGDVIAVRVIGESEDVNNSPVVC
jgi:hypothetical protein